MKTQLHTKILIFLLFLAFQLVQAQSFTELTTANLPGLRFSAATWGDYDNDGDLDVVVIGYDRQGSQFSALYKNNGNGTFTDINAGLLDVLKGSVSWGDYDNDGDLDLLLTGNKISGIETIIYRNDGNDTFTEIDSKLPAVFESAAAWGDYDNDGDLDVLITGNASAGNKKLRISEIYRNNGDATFTSIKAGLIGVNNSSVAWGDYDNDGDLDILLAGEYGDAFEMRTSEVYRNNGDGTFTKIISGLPSISYCSVAWGDYNNDGYLDILFAGDEVYTISMTRIYKNNGDGTFTFIDAKLPGVHHSSVAWGDVDNDGDLDVLLLGKQSSISILSRIYRNNGDNTFTDINAGFDGLTEGSASFADIDNDGDLDVLLSGVGSNLRTYIYVNNSTKSNTIPSAPSNLSATVNENEVTLSWSASTDAETPSSGLSYNVFIKEVPTSGSVYLKSPMASETNGWRKLPALGNAMQNTSYKYKVPASAVNPNFTFKVQAIDGGFLGSAFSAEGVFSTLAVNAIDKLSDIKIYPNPVSNILTIENPFSANLQLNVFNNLGQMVLKQNQNASSTSLNVSNLSRGLYFLKIASENNSIQTIKFIKN